MGKKFEKEYQVYYYDVDSNMNCRIESLMNYFMETGMQQSKTLDVGFGYLHHKNLAWVFYKYNINIKRYPKYDEKIKVVTEPLGFKRFLGCREYIVYDENNEVIVEAKSVMVLVDLIKRRMTRIPDDQYDIYGIDKKSYPDINLDKPEKLNDITGSKKFEIRLSDIDSNKHVNNVKYVSFALDSLPIEIIDKYILSDIQIIFEKEAIYGENIEVSYKIFEEENNILKIAHSITNEEGKEINFIESLWKLK